MGMIPAEAVEAAAKAIYSDGWDGAPYWEAMADDNSDKIHHRAIAQNALEAAAPYMLAEAWGKGFGAGWNDCLLDLENGGAKTTVNPYMLNNEALARPKPSGN